MGAYSGCQRVAGGAAWEVRRVVRGGSWRLGRVVARASYRSNSDPGDRFNYFGFRVVCVSPIR